jgi:hypothetical protein
MNKASQPEKDDRPTVPSSDGAVRELEKADLAARARPKGGEQAARDNTEEIVSLGKAGDGAPEEAAAEVDNSHGD